MDTLAPLRKFVRQVQRLVQEGGANVPERAAVHMRTLVTLDDWLPDSMAAAHERHYQQYLLYADPADYFSLVSFVWGPGQQTPIHDHTVWGVIGMLRGAEYGQRYELAKGGAPRKCGEETRLEPGSVEIVSPLHGDVHRVRSASDGRVSISIHLYGGNIGRIRRSTYDALTGSASDFVSGYSRILEGFDPWTDTPTLHRERPA